MKKAPPTFASGGLRGMARRFVSGLEFYRNVIGRPIGDAREARPGVGQASRLEPREDAPGQFCLVARRFAFYLRYNLFLFKISRYRGAARGLQPRNSPQQ